MEMELIHEHGKWKVYKVPNIDPVEFLVTNGYRKYYNMDAEAATRLAEFLYRGSLEKDDLQEA